jgi:SanA protein
LEVYRKPKSWLRRVGRLIWLLGVAVVSIYLCGNIVVWGVGRWHIAETPDGLDPAPTALILGAGPGSLALENRLEAGIELWNSGRVEHLIISGGGDGTGFAETDFMRRYLVNRGLPEDVIIVDSLGLRTLDSVHRAQGFFGYDSVILITQRYHLYRAMFLGRCKGLTVQGFAAVDAERRFFLSTRFRESLARVRAVLDVLTFRGPRFPDQAEADWIEESP